MRKSLLALLMAATMCTVLLAGCGSSDQPADGGDQAASGDVPKVGGKYAIFIATNSNAFTMAVGDAAVEKGKELGVEITVFDGKGDQNTQVNQIETCITQGYTGLIVEPVTNDGCNQVIKEAQDVGVPVMTVIQTCAIQDQLPAFVGQSNVDGSYEQAKAACEAIGGKGNVCILTGQMGTSGEIDCTTGINKALAEYPNVKVMEIQSANWMIDEALKVTETWLQKHSDIDAIIAENGNMACGATKACVDAGIKEQIYVCGRDAVADELASIKKGEQDATVYQDPIGIGSMAVETMHKIVNGETVERMTYSKNIVVNKDNVDEYL